MFKKILPREYQFFDYFESHSQIIIKTAQALKSLGATDISIIDCQKKVKELEREADEITHTCTNALVKTFITPIERSDIHQLIKRMDDIVDCIDSAMSRMVLYEIKEVRKEVVELADVLYRSSMEIEAGLKCLKETKSLNEAGQRCINIHKLENEGDIIFRQALTNLFRETDPILVIKWKEIFERFEKAVDRCEDVANIMESVIITS